MIRLRVLVISRCGYQASAIPILLLSYVGR